MYAGGEVCDLLEPSPPPLPSPPHQSVFIHLDSSGDGGVAVAFGVGRTMRTEIGGEW